MHAKWIDMIDWLALANYTMVMSITPGPNNVMVLASGARFGVRRTLPHLAGISLGFSLQAVLVCAFFGVVEEALLKWHTTLAWVGIAYMTYLSWKLLHAGPIAKAEVVQPLAAWQSALFQWLNPKAWVMALTTASVFMPREGDPWSALMGIGTTLVLVNFPCIALWAGFGTAIASWLGDVRRRSIFNVTMALLLAWTAWRMLPSSSLW